MGRSNKRKACDRGGDGDCHAPGDEEQEDEVETPRRPKKDPANALNLKLLKDFRSYDKEHVTNSRTITRTLKAFTRAAPWAPHFKEVVTTVSDAYGILSHLVTVYLNIRAIEVQDCPRLFNRNYYAHLVELFADADYGDAQASMDPHLRAYLDHKDHKLDEDTKTLVRAGLKAARRCKGDFSGKLEDTIKRHLADNIDDRIKQYVAWQAERLPVVWALRGEEGFKKLLVRLGNAVLNYAAFTIGAHADAAREAFYAGTPALRHPTVDAVFVEWRGRLQQLRTQPLNKDGTPKPPAADQRETKHGNYKYNIKVKQHVILSLMRHMRVGPEASRQMVGDVWRQINEDTPSLYGKPTRSAVRLNLCLAPVAAAGVEARRGELTREQLERMRVWSAEGPERLEQCELEQISAGFKMAVKQQRWQLLEVWSEPGMISRPAKFTLLPKFKLAPYCITLDAVAISTIGNAVQKKMQAAAKPFHAKRSDPLWYLAVFDMYGQEERQLRTPRIIRLGPDGNDPPNRDYRKVRTQRTAKIRKGLPLLWSTPWMLDPHELRRRQQDEEQVAPPLVNTITTDGLQVHVTLVQRDRPGAPGIDGLAQKNFTGVPDEPLDLSKHNRGVFKSVVPLTAAVLEVLNSGDRATFVEMVGVDPGIKLMLTAAKARLGGTPAPAAQDTGADAPTVVAPAADDGDAVMDDIAPDPLRPDPSAFKNKRGCVVFSNQYRRDSLAVASEQYEADRRATQADYAAALRRFDDLGASLTASGGHLPYAQAMYAGLAAMRAELFTEERRQLKFARSRARDRTMSRISRGLAGRDPDIHTKKMGPEPERLAETRDVMRGFLAERSGQPKTREAEEGERSRIGHSRTRMRVVFFGDAQFGQGRTGPLPRKALLRKLGQLCPVVITDEYLTSKKCAGACGTRLVPVPNCRVFRCVRSQRLANGGCGVSFIDRDVNGAVNIAIAGWCMLLGLPRPWYLTRPVAAAAVLDGDV